MERLVAFPTTARSEAGARPRLVPVLRYAERPGLRNSEAVRKLFRGRTEIGDDPGNRRAKA